MPKIVGKKTKSLIENGLCHFTKSDYLEKILTEDGILMKASCIKAYWKDEVNSFDDNQEVKGLMELQSIIKVNPKNINPGRKLICAEVVKRLIDNGDASKSSTMANRDLQPIASTTTPYIICFGYDCNDEHMFHKFCNPQCGYPVMLKFNFDKLLNNSTKWKFMNEGDFKQVDDSTENEEIMQVYYTKFKSFCDSKDVKDTHKEAYEELGQAFKKDNDSYNTKIDSMYYVKRGRYRDEKEIRYILRINEPSAFGLNSTGEFIFKTEKAYGNMSVDQAINCMNCERHYEGENTDAYILVRFDPECLEKIILGQCAPETLIGEIQDKLNRMGDIFKHVKVEKFNKKS